MKSRALLALERRRQQVLWAAPVWIVAAAGTASLGLALAGAEPRLRMLALGAGVVAALIVRLVRRLPLREVARALEAEMGSRNRLEALVELGGRDDPLAQALTADAERFLARHPLPRPYAWIAGVGVSAALALSHLLISSAPTAPAPITSVPIDEPARALSVPEDLSIEPMRAPPASLRWISSTEEMSTGPEDERPLIAEAESVTGLRAVVLDILGGGELSDVRPVADTVAPGVQTLATKLRPAASVAPTRTWVAYYLKAERIRPPDLPAETSWPSVVSPLQVILWRGPGASIATGELDPDPAVEVIESLQELQRLQRQVLVSAFALRHGLEPGSEAGVHAGSSAVTARQQDVVADLSELVARVSSEALSADGGHMLEQAGGQGRRAVEALASEVWGAGMEEQLSLLKSLAAAEQSATQAWRERQARRAAEDAERLERLAKSFGDTFPERAKTPAGRLETLAREQTAIAGRLERKTGGEGTFTAQDGVVRALSSVMAEEALPTALNDLLAAAMDAATEARTQLNEGDELAATEPAARAMQALDEATARLDEIGRDRATEDLLAAQDDFLRSASEVQAAGEKELEEVARRAAEKTRQRQEQLRKAAQREQNAGSEKAARRLEELSRSIEECGVCEELGGAGEKGGKGEKGEQGEEEKGGNSATGEKGGGDAGQKQAAEKLEQLAKQAAASAEEIGDASKLQRRIAGDLESIRRQLDEEAPAQDELREIRRELLVNMQRLGRSDRVPPPPGPGVMFAVLNDYRAELRRRVAGLLALAGPTEPAVGRRQTLATANPAEAPPAYRSAVADYFESLARFRDVPHSVPTPPSSSRSND